MLIDTPAALALRASDLLGESPHWETRTERLVRVDILAGAVHCWSPDTGAESTAVLGDRVSTAIPAVTGGLVAAVDEHIVAVQDGASRTLVAIEPHLDSTRVNDGKCDQGGRLWVGTYALDGAPVCGLYRADASGRVDKVLSGLRAANGLAWDAAGDEMYVVDSMAHRIEAIAVDDADCTVLARRVAVQLDPATGLPDGIATDTEGGIWVALFGSSSIHRYTPDGELTAIVELPVSNPTSVAFGGPDLATLYVTSSRHHLTGVQAEEQPLAGSVFAVEPGVRGVPVAPFGDEDP